MKKLLFAFLLICSFQHSKAQEDTVALYKRFPVVPVFSIMTVPDSSRFTNENLQKKRPVIIMLFSPDCGHCQLAVKDLKEHIALFKKAQIIMVSSLDFDEINRFYKEYNIAEDSNIVMGRDAAYLLGTFYKLHHYPSMFVYNKKKKFVKAFEGTFKMETVAESL